MKTNNYKGVLIITPTRNRYNIVINGLKSSLSNPLPNNFKILISDDSSEANDAEALRKFCEKHKSKIIYVKTPGNLSMTQHYEWAIHQGLKLKEFNHFCFLTDRMIFKKGVLQMIDNLLKKNPNYLISYNNDHITDHIKPVQLKQNVWSGKAVKINTAKLLYCVSQVRFHSSLPRMINCVVPRSVLNNIEKKFGSVFDSIAPDFCFCFRCLYLLKDFIYIDKSLIVDYATYRSNGVSQSRGVITKDNKYYNSKLGKLKVNHASPVPGFITTNNIIVNEYLIVKSETKSKKFKDINNNNYFEQIAIEILRIENPKIKTQMVLLLLKKDKKALFHILKAFMIISVIFLRPKLKFKSSKDAIDYNNNHPRLPTSDLKHLKNFVK